MAVLVCSTKQVVAGLYTRNVFLRAACGSADRVFDIPLVYGVFTLCVCDRTKKLHLVMAGCSIRIVTSSFVAAVSLLVGVGAFILLPFSISAILTSIVSY